MSKTVKIILGVALVVIVAGGAGIWWFALRDTAEKSASLDAIATPTTKAGSGGTTGGGTGSSSSSADGTWTVQAANDVFVGYRIEELFGGQTIKKTATGRTPAVTGTMTVAGSQIPTAEITADVTKLKSDEERRDSAVRNRGLETGKIGTATFELTQPIALPAPPKQGEEVSVTATGDLTLHGVTTSVQIPLKAKWTGDTIAVAGSLPITLADYQIATIEIPGFVTIDDNGTLELQLLFVRA